MLNGYAHASCVSKFVNRDMFLPGELNVEAVSFFPCTPQG